MAQSLRVRADRITLEAGPAPRDGRPARSVRRTLVVAALVTLALAAAAIVLWDHLAPAAIDRVYHDPRFGLLHDAIHAHAQLAPDHRDPAYYVRNGRMVLTRGLIVAAGIELLVLALVFRRETVRFARAFFGASAPPTSLAVFRIVLFAVLFIKVAITDTAYYSALPDTLRMPPLGMAWLASVVPIDPTTTASVRAAFYVACTAAILGLFSRVSAFLSLLLGAYALGVPQMFGSMNADHHLLWFAALLAVSPCGDVLALDAVRAAWREADRGVVEPPGPARAYALPLRFVWLLLGVIYFFPGFWKVWRAGLEWMTAENLGLHLRLKWAEFHDWAPLFRADEYPLVLLVAAIGTVVFEVGFVFLIFSARGRMLAAAVGLAFHNTCWALLNITFWLLQLMYVALVDWAALFARVGRALFPETMLVGYDGACRHCRRAVATLRRFDVFGRITWVDGSGASVMAAHGFGQLDRREATAGMYAVAGTRVWEGFAAFRALAARIPALWIVRPLLALPALDALWTRIHRPGAALHAAVSPVVSTAPVRHDRTILPAAVLGAILLAGNVGFGMANVHMAWPLFCFPTFAWIAQPRGSRLGIEVVEPDGQTLDVDVRELNGRKERGFTPERLQGLIIAIFAEPPARRNARLRALWGVVVDGTGEFAAPKAVRFYRDTITTDPGRRDEPPLARELLYELAA